MPLGEAVDEDALALPAAGDALAATLARGKKRHRRRHTPTESSLFPRPHPEGAPAWPPTCHPPASVAASDASHSWRPLIALGKLGQLGLLLTLYGNILIPREVYNEVVVNGLRLGADDASAVDFLVQQGYIRVVEVALPSPLPV